MGYTHYWREVGSFSTNFVINASRIIDHKRHILDVTDIDSFCVSFNGRGDDAHETFIFASNSPGFAFCKTAAKPYDVVVTAVLALAVHCGILSRKALTSDGAPADWDDGVHLARKVTGYEIANPFDLEHPNVPERPASDANATLGVTVKLTQRSCDRIDALRTALGFSTDADVISRAVSLLNTLAVEVGKGGHVHLVRENGDVLLLDALVSE